MPKPTSGTCCITTAGGLLADECAALDVGPDEDLTKEDQANL